MTVDGKIGLLLGFLFIVVIAFLINGPSGFLKADKPVIETAVPAPPGRSIVIEEAVADVARQLDPPPLRQSQPPQEVRVLDPVSADSEAVTLQMPSAAPSLPQAVAAQGRPAPEAVPVASTKIHTVQTGENLAVIAVRYYGKEEGNRRATIQKLFEANSRILESADTIRVGDRLAIPSLEQLTAPPARQEVKPEKKLLDRFKDMFEPASAGGSSSRYTEYVVQPGDRLWEIAQTHLGDGKRYTELVKLNRQQISDPDHVPAGIRLKIPVR